MSFTILEIHERQTRFYIQPNKKIKTERVHSYFIAMNNY
jgi:hypothetical protein